MADLTLTGDSKSAVHAITDIKGALAAAQGVAFNMLGTIQTLNKTIAQQGAQQAVFRSVTDAINKQAQAVRETTQEFKNQVVEARDAGIAIRALLNNKGQTLNLGFDPGQKAQLESALGSLNLKMKDLSLAATPVKQVFTDLLAGNTPTGLDDKLRAILPILKSIVQLDVNRTTSAQRVTDKVKAQVDAYNDLQKAQAKIIADKSTGRVFGTSTSPGQADLKNASVDEINKLNVANLALATSNAKAGLSFSQLKQLAADYLSGTKRSFTDAEKIVLPAIVRQQTAIAGLGKTFETTTAKAAQAAKDAAARVSTSYDAANNSLGALLLSWRSVIRLASIQTLHLAFGRLVSTVFEANRRMLELNTNIALIQTISQQAQLTTDQWTDSLVRLSTSKGFDVVEVAAAAYEAISNQVVKGANSFVFLGQALDFARATQTSALDSVNLLSSAIQSFGLNAEDTKQIASEFFAVIDLGRVKGIDLANSFGRIGPVAHQLGISLAETGAAIALLTNVGVKEREVLTELSGIMNKLISPTKEMKSFFDELGVSGGEAAIKTFGLLGVFQKLSDAAATSDDRLGELVQKFNEIRALRGAAFFASTEALELFDSTIKKVTNSQESYGEAVRITSQSTTAIIQKSTEEFKNHILENIVKPFQTFLANLIKGGTTLTDIFVRVESSIVPVVAGFLAWKVVSASVTTLIPSFLSFVKVWNNIAAAEAAAAAETEGAAAALANYAAVMATLKSIGVLAVTGIITAFVVARQQQIALADQARIEQTRITDEILAKDRDTSIKQQAIQTTLTDNFKKALDDRFQSLRQFAASVTRLETTLSKALTEGFKTSFETSKIIVEDFISTLNEHLSSVKSTLSQTQTLLKSALSESAKDQTDFSRKQFEAFISNMEQLGGKPQDLVNAIKERQQALEQAARTASASVVNPDGTVNENAHNDARRALEETEQLQQRIADVLRRQSENASPAKQAQIRDILTQMISPAGEFANIQRLQNQLQDEYIAKLKIVEQLKIKERDLQEQTLEKVKTQFKILEDTLSKKAETPEEQKQKLGDSTTQIGDIFKTLVGAGLNLDSAAKVFQSFQENLKIQTQQIQTTQQAANLVASKQSIDALQTKQKDLAKKQTDTLAKNSAANNAIADTISKFAAELQNRLATESSNEFLFQGNKVIGGTVAQSAIANGLDPRFVGQGNLDGQAFVDITTLFNNLKTAAEAIKVNASPANLKNLTDAFAQVKILISAASEGNLPAFAGNGIPGETATPNIDITKLLNQLSIVQGQADQITRNVAASNQAQANLAALTTALQQTKQGYEAQIKLLDTAAQREIKDDDSRERMIALLAQANDYLALIAPAQHKAAGGWISGGRAGFDSVPIMAMPGEFIVNARDAQRNAGLLSAMNSGSMRGYARGGFVRSNGGTPVAGNAAYDFSGMSVNVQGGSTNRETALEIGKILEQEVRRGTIRL